MTDTIKILVEMQKWRKGEFPYDSYPCEMPYTPEDFGDAIDTAINVLKSQSNA